MVTDRKRFILSNTGILRPPHVPEIRLHLASEAFELWSRTEEELEKEGLPPPFWAFAWAGGQGLARYILDNPAIVAGRTVLDFASGSGLVAIAAALAGAQSVSACDIDPWAMTAIAVNAELNRVQVTLLHDDPVGTNDGWQVVLAGDVFYEKPLADRIEPWFRALARRGTAVLVGDPGRHYLPKQLLQQLETYEVPVDRVLEDAEIKRTTVWKIV